MPIRLKDMQKATKTIQIDFNGETLEVEYWMYRATPAFLRDMETWDDKEALEKAVCAVVKRWDLLDEDGQEIPPTVEVARELPVEFLREVQTAILDDMRGGEAEKKD